MCNRFNSFSCHLSLNTYVPYIVLKREKFQSSFCCILFDFRFASTTSVNNGSCQTFRNLFVSVINLEVVQVFDVVMYSYFWGTPFFKLWNQMNVKKSLILISLPYTCEIIITYQQLQSYSLGKYMANLGSEK